LDSNSNSNQTHSTKDEGIPVLTSYSSLLSSVECEINAHEVEQHPPLPSHRKILICKKLSLQEALLCFDDLKADLTITSSTSSLSECSEEKQGKDHDEEDEDEDEDEDEEKVEKCK
jgi:hypothetical protein